MISEVILQDLSRACVPHAPAVKSLQGVRRVEFKPGLNILWGPNGSGKSTLLTAIARMLHCEQGGRTCVTDHSMQAVFTVPSDRSKVGEWSSTMADGILPVHDGQPTTFCDPSVAVGLVGGMAGFDYDFLLEGTDNAMYAGSAGEVTNNRMRHALLSVVDPQKHVAPATWRTSKESSRAKAVAAFLAGSIPKGQLTVLLDEPDRSLSIKFQAGLWYNLARQYGKNVQVIAATHSPLALSLPDTHYVEMIPGYLAECRKVVEDHIVVPGAVKLLGIRKGEDPGHAG